MGSNGSGRKSPEDMHEAASEASALLKALANEDRLLILCHLADGEKNVSELGELLEMRQPAGIRFYEPRRRGLPEKRRS